MPEKREPLVGGEASSTGPRGRLRRLLVVDDEPIVHSAVRLVLRREFDIVDCMSAEDALTDLEPDLERGDFDVVLLDVKMPGVPDGVDFFRQLQQIDPAKAPAVIFMTGDPHIASVLGATMRATCLAKPFAAEELRAAIAGIRSTTPPSSAQSTLTVRP